MRRSSVGLAALVLVLGCARAVAKPPAPAASSTTISAPGASPASIAVPGSLDPSEVITPGELASIPDPVPVGDATANVTQGAAGTEDAPVEDAPGTEGAPTALPDSDAAPTVVAQESRAEGGSTAATGDGHASVWRVQIFASPDLTQADRVAKEASARFGVPSVIEFEGSLYKVRLGAFSSEALAQSLRERAVSEGYPGAFRMRSSDSSNGDTR